MKNNTEFNISCHKRGIYTKKVFVRGKEGFTTINVVKWKIYKEKGNVNIYTVKILHQTLTSQS